MVFLQTTTNISRTKKKCAELFILFFQTDLFVAAVHKHVQKKPANEKQNARAVKHVSLQLPRTLRVVSPSWRIAHCVSLDVQTGEHGLGALDVYFCFLLPTHGRAGKRTSGQAFPASARQITQLRISQWRMPQGRMPQGWIANLANLANLPNLPNLANLPNPASVALQTATRKSASAAAGLQTRRKLGQKSSRKRKPRIQRVRKCRGCWKG